MVIIFKPSIEDIKEYFRVVLSDRSKAVGKNTFFFEASRYLGFACPI